GLDGRGADQLRLVGGRVVFGRVGAEKADADLADADDLAVGQGGVALDGPAINLGAIGRLLVTDPEAALAGEYARVRAGGAAVLPNDGGLAVAAEEDDGVVVQFATLRMRDATFDDQSRAHDERLSAYSGELSGYRSARTESRLPVVTGTKKERTTKSQRSQRL